MTNTSLRTKPLVSPSSPTWSDRYGDRHRLERITDFPRGVVPPSKVRLYWRRDHYVLRWWDPGVKRTLSDRVEGDLVAALTRIRVIEGRLQERGTCHNNGHRRLTFADLMQAFQKNLRQRADADEIDIRTVGRYASALAYLRHFSEQPSIQSRYPHPGRVDRDFVLEFLAFLKTRVVTRNGRARGASGQLTGVEYILATAHAAFTWAADPDRGAHLASDFRNPFRGQAGAIRSRSADPCAAPPITIPMAVDWLQACDDFQRRLFVPLILFGLRAAELCWVFTEDVDDQWFHVRCHLELDYLTKGRRDKKFPVVPSLRWFLDPPASSVLWLPRRDFRPPEKMAVEKARLVELYRQQVERLPESKALTRRQARDAVLHEAGTLDHDRIEGEFRELATRLNWPRTATLKGFRHMFATALENSGCPESYRHYFLGHSPGKSAIVRYTHLDQLERHYRRLLDGEFSPIMQVLKSSVGHESSHGQ